MPHRISTFLIVIGLATMLLYAATAGAKRPDPNVSVNPNPASTGSNLMFSGCGYAVSSSVTVVIVSPFATSFTGASTDASGCFSTSGWGYTALMAGSYTVDVFQPTDHHNPSGALTFSVS
ncbi:MAG: hypothetical protein ACXVQ3_05255 [Gaiellaceae bacterium]